MLLQAGHFLGCDAEILHRFVSIPIYDIVIPKAIGRPCLATITDSEEDQ